MVKMIDLYSQYLGIKEEIDRAIDTTITTSDFIGGNAVVEFERALSSFLSVEHIITCGNGSDALLLSLMAIGLKKGDEVIVPAFAFASVVEAVALLGGVPVFADVNHSTFAIDPASIERMVTKRTKAIVPVHLFGQPCDMKQIKDIAETYDVVVIEDNAQSLGAKCRLSSECEVYAGTIGHIGYTSFFPTKMLGCFGDGGAVFTNDNVLADRIRAIANHGQHRKYHHEYIGINSRLDTLQAAILKAKIPHLPDWIESRQKAARYYSAALKDIEQLILPLEVPHGTHVYNQYTIRMPISLRDGLKTELTSKGIQSMIYYPTPLFNQPAYRNICVIDPMMSDCETLCRQVLSLPMHSELSHNGQDKVIDTIQTYITRMS